jgi:hypothetical protein
VTPELRVSEFEAERSSGVSDGLPHNGQPRMRKAQNWYPMHAPTCNPATVGNLGIRVVPALVQNRENISIKRIDQCTPKSHLGCALSHPEHLTRARSKVGCDCPSVNMVPIQNRGTVSSRICWTARRPSCREAGSDPIRNIVSLHEALFTGGSMGHGMAYNSYATTFGSIFSEGFTTDGCEITSLSP